MSHPLNFILLLVTMVRYGCSITCHCSNGPQTMSYRTSVKAMIRDSQNTEICANNFCTINSTQLSEVDRKRVNPGCLLITRDNNEVVLQYCMFYMKNFPVGNVPAVVNDLYLWGCQTVGSTHTCICASDFCNQAVQRTTTTTSTRTTTTSTTTTTPIPWFTTGTNSTTSAATTSSASTTTTSTTPTTTTTTTQRPIDTTPSSRTSTITTTPTTTPRPIDTTPSSRTSTTTTTHTTTPRPIDTTPSSRTSTTTTTTTTRKIDKTTPNTTTRTTTTTTTTTTPVAITTIPTSTTAQPTKIKVVTRNWVDAIFTPKPASGCRAVFSNILILVVVIDLMNAP